MRIKYYLEERRLPAAAAGSFNEMNAKGGLR
jgi:hypothetical protein